MGKRKRKFKVFCPENVESITAKKLQKIENNKTKRRNTSGSERKSRKPPSKKCGSSSSSATPETISAKEKPTDDRNEVENQINLPEEGQDFRVVEETSVINKPLIEPNTGNNTLEDTTIGVEMSIDQEIFKQQVCSVCHKYLSVGAVKVYPNRQVKCGRCTTDNDYGVESKLFLTVIRDMKFPCINSLEGCRERLPISEMKNHEDNCKSNIYECPMCQKFEGAALELTRHCENFHKGETLNSKEFFIDLGIQGNQQGCYFYCKGLLPVFVMFTCEEDSNKIRLRASVVGKKYQGDILQRWTVKNKAVFKTKKMLCSRLNTGQGEDFNINISKLRFDKNIVSCKFEIIERPVLNIEKQRFDITEKIRINDSGIDCFEVLCLFSDISKLPNYQKIYSDYPQIYLSCNLCWKFFIIKLSENSVSVYLEWHKIENYEAEAKKCTFNIKFTLLSSKQSYEKGLYNSSLFPGHHVGLYFGEIKDIYTKNESIQNDSIKIKIKVDSIFKEI